MELCCCTNLVSDPLADNVVRIVGWRETSTVGGIAGYFSRICCWAQCCDPMLWRGCCSAPGGRRCRSISPARTALSSKPAARRERTTDARPIHRPCSACSQQCRWFSLLVILQVNEPASSVNTSALGKLHSFFCVVALSSCCIMAIGVKLKTCARLKIWYCAFSPTEHCASERSVLLLYIVKHNVVLQTCLNLLSYKLCLFEHCRSTYCGLLDMHVSLRGI